MSEQDATGTVKWFNDAKGYGFISADKGGDLFVHFKSIKGNGFRSLKEGQKVKFQVKQGPKGLQAEEVEAMGDHKPR
jgi:CspA family cold shock protein